MFPAIAHRMNAQLSTLNSQPSLFDPPRHAANADVAWFQNFLRENKGWHTATEILTTLGRQGNDEVGKRWLRRLAADSTWILSGQSGYKALEHATAEEIDHAANWLEHQAKEMSDRAGGIRRNAHKIFG